MPIKTIDEYLDTIPEEWKRTAFVDRLENARMLVDDPEFASTEEVSKSLTTFLSLTGQERTTEVERLRVLNVAGIWAKKATTSVADINSVITSLRQIREAKKAPEVEPEPESEVSE